MRRNCTVAVAIGFALLLPAAAHADTFTVAAPTESALAEAVDAANARDGADTVLLAGHTIVLSEDDIDVFDDLTLRGPGTLDGSGLESDAIIEAWANLTIEDVRLIGTNDDRALLVLAPDAAVRVERSYFGDNEGAIGVYPSQPSAAASAAEQLAGASLVVTDTTFEGNVDRYGGAIDIDSGQELTQVTVARSTFTGNKALSDGEGSARGGAIHVWRGGLTVENSTFSGNTAAGPSFGSGGGAIAVDGSGATTLTHVTITGNTAEGGARGGGIAGPRFDGIGAASFVPVTVVNSIVAGNTSDVIEEERLPAAAPRADDCDFSVGTLGGNLEGGETCGFRDASDKQNTDPKLAALAANGGPTKTHALAADSPAVNMAGAAKCLATDQRGMPRVASACDSGAYELVPPATQPSAPAGGALGEQASSDCLSDRRFKIRLRVPRGEEVSKAIVKVNGKRVKVKRGKRLTAIVDLRGLEKKRYKVSITLRLKGGGKVSGVRRYWTCTPAIRWTKPPKV
jgi:polymorphic membrane protein